MNYRENNVSLFGKLNQPLDYTAYSTMNIGAAQSQVRRQTSDPYLSLYLVKDYSYIDGKITTKPDDSTQYVELLSSLGGLWTGLTSGELLIVYLYTQSHLMLYIVDKLYLSKKVKEENKSPRVMKRLGSKIDENDVNAINALT